MMIHSQPWPGPQFSQGFVIAFIAKMLFLDTIYTASSSPPKASVLTPAVLGGGGVESMTVRPMSPSPSITKPGSGNGIMAVTFRKGSFIVLGFLLHPGYLLTL